ncbi:hypothetical protein J007_02060 [Cryptococcus neoformans]|nr:hypothetical protein C356_02081 [Cryptococcus neoformans var. grubii c45]OXB38144.1 hypothetical protein J007_02060 [Cryptococcus neoformans var. grubii]OXC62460.1 hypothetical protein C358_02126 [Cryptococcus neoformans var. grubii MW-RSA852]
MVSPAFPGLFFAFAAAVLLLFASISPPAWDQVGFLTTTAGTTKTVFGVFGECVKGGSCSRRSVGYDLIVNGATNVNINQTVLHNLTYAMILHPIAGFLALLALVFGLLGACAASRVATIFMALCSALGLIVTLVVFVIDMVLWNIVKNHARDGGVQATLGNANWFTVAALASLFLSMCTSVCGACGRFANGRMAGEKY